MTDVQHALADNLKEFQRRTVDYVSQRLYGTGATDRFLVADEVGLGKTLVARGIIAKAIEHLSETTKRIDVIYRAVGPGSVSPRTGAAVRPPRPCVRRSPR